MLTKKVRTEYMKKFRDPKWETFSKCYEDSLKYRLTRRLIEQSHKPWFWEGWDSGSDSSGWSTPRLNQNKVTPLSLPPPEVRQRLCELMSSSGPEDGGGGGAVDAEAAVEHRVTEGSSGSVPAAPNVIHPSEDTETDNGPVDSASSNGGPANPAPKRRQRRHVARSESDPQESSCDDKKAVARKPPRAKSQPAISSKEKENRKPSCRLDWTKRQVEVRRMTNDNQKLDTCVPTRRDSDRKRSTVDRRRARSADLEKMRKSQLVVVVDERWMTEYMRCFSARMR